MAETTAMIQALPCWHGPVSPAPLAGGITNLNFVVEDAGAKFVVRLGGDIPVHQIMRFNELAASRAAHAAGLSPEVVYAQTGVLVLRFIDGRVYDAAAVRQNLPAIVTLLQHTHREIPKHIRGPALVFWVFHVIRDYAHTLEERGSSHTQDLPSLLAICAELERAVGPVEIAFCHNDLLPANLIDDGRRLWLIDWDYGGFNTPLFDLANLASNNSLSLDQERWLLDAYFDRPPGDRVWRAYTAMKCASLLRETMWSMVSEICSRLDFDYPAYTAENRARFERAYAGFKTLE
ncbi:MAG: choline/ethanolamine kinase family protein [Alphaproteobacteria bacterium]